MTQTGVYVGNDPSALLKFEQWLGRSVDGVHGVVGFANWSDFVSSARWGVETLWSQVDRTVHWSVPLIVEGASLQQAASGGYNSYYKQVAQTLAASRPSDDKIFIRTGWEFNGDWFPWSAEGQEQAFIGAFRQFVDTFRSVSDRFVFEWNVNRSGEGEMNPATAYPGDAYVDIIGMDFYYNPQWDSADPVQAWSEIVNEKYGLQWHQNFAAAHNKPTAYSEWGVTTNNAGPMIALAQSWFDKHNVVFQSYWDSDDAYPGKLSDNTDTQTGAAYIEAFSNVAQSPLPLPQPSEPVPLTSKIVGTTGNDNLQGTAENDVIYGFGGSDTLNGGGGADTMSGGSGNDLYYLDNTGDQVVETADGGTDKVVTSISYTLSSYIENLSASGSSALNLTGNSLNNVIVGNAGANTISGGEGNDRFNGRAGNDQLTGGTGKDVFVFNAALNKTSNVDTITDFSVADDTVWLENAIFNKLTQTGELSRDYFTTGTAAKDANDYIIYNKSNGYLYYDADGSGQGAAVLFAKLPNKPALTNLDFIVT